MLVKIFFYGSLWYCLTNATFSYAVDLQRLFTTPQQRYELDENRYQQAQEEAKKMQQMKPIQGTTEDGQEINLPNPPPHITFNGFLQKSGKKPMVWINGSNNLPEFEEAGYAIHLNRDQTSISVKLRKRNLTITLLPGETLDTINIKKLQPYEFQPITVADWQPETITEDKEKSEDQSKKSTEASTDISKKEYEEIVKEYLTIMQPKLESQSKE